MCSIHNVRDGCISNNMGLLNFHHHETVEFNTLIKILMKPTLTTTATITFTMNQKKCGWIRNGEYVMVWC